jgi:hypothetical protein
MDKRQGMTIKEIAELCNVDRTTILRWAQKVKDGAICTEISANCTEAQDVKEPAKLGLRAVIAIIRAGGRETLASLLMDNTGRQVPEKPTGLPESGAVFELIGIIRSQAVVIESLVKKERGLGSPDAGSAPAMLADRINTTQLAVLYGKSRATCLSHARAMGWTMRVSRLETGSLTYEFLLASLPEKIKTAWVEYKEREATKPEAILPDNSEMNTPCRNADNKV